LGSEYAPAGGQNCTFVSKLKKSKRRITPSAPNPPYTLERVDFRLSAFHCYPFSCKYGLRGKPLQEESVMSERALAFVEEWVNENVHATGYEPEGDSSLASALAQQCLAEAKVHGIAEVEMKDAFEDLTQFMAGQIKLVNDNEVDRLASKDE
jgi:hypothetical protein